MPGAPPDCCLHAVGLPALHKTNVYWLKLIVPHYFYHPCELKASAAS
jgi:hypothetical protein